jgi:hypothetical protein
MKIKYFVIIIIILGKRTVCEVNNTQRKKMFYEHSKLKLLTIFQSLTCLTLLNVTLIQIKAHLAFWKW